MTLLPVSGIALAVREPTGEDEIYVLETALAPVPAILELARRVARTVAGGPLDWASLPATDLDAAALVIRRSWIGEVIRTDTKCPGPGCRERIDVSFGIGDYLRAIIGPGGRAASIGAAGEGWLTLAGTPARFRVPTVADLLAAVSCDQPAAELSSRCVDAPELSRALARRLDRALSALAPSLDDLLGGSCPACGHKVTMRFDPLGYTLTELRQAFSGIHLEAHALAAAYGWPEDRDPRPSAQPTPALRVDDRRRTARRMKAEVPYLARLARQAAGQAMLRPPRQLFAGDIDMPVACRTAEDLPGGRPSPRPRAFLGRWRPPPPATTGSRREADRRGAMGADTGAAATGRPRTRDRPAAAAPVRIAPGARTPCRATSHRAGRRHASRATAPAPQPPTSAWQEPAAGIPVTPGRPDMHGPPQAAPRRRSASRSGAARRWPGELGRRPSRRAAGRATGSEQLAARGRHRASAATRILGEPAVGSARRSAGGRSSSLPWPARRHGGPYPRHRPGPPRRHPGRERPHRPARRPGPAHRRCWRLGGPRGRRPPSARCRARR